MRPVEAAPHGAQIGEAARTRGQVTGRLGLAWVWVIGILRAGGHRAAAGGCASITAGWALRPDGRARNRPWEG